MVRFLPALDQVSPSVFNNLMSQEGEFLSQCYNSALALGDGFFFKVKMQEKVILDVEDECQWECQGSRGMWMTKQDWKGDYKEI